MSVTTVIQRVATAVMSLVVLSPTTSVEEEAQLQPTLVFLS